MSVVVNSGPDPTHFMSANTLFTTVTLCVHGTTTCQTIDHIQVDTASYGFRVLASALNSTMLNALPVASASDGHPLVECAQFADGYSWGPVSVADLQVGGETANSLPIQIIGSDVSPSYYPISHTTVPAACIQGYTGNAISENTVDSFGANGIIGIGVFKQDCGLSCQNGTSAGVYYSCISDTSSAVNCTGIAVPVANQVLNPVPLFTTDNNGSIIVLPTAPAAGETTLTGSLIFGIDTETNNVSGTQTVLTVDDYGDFTTIFNSQTYDTSFIDSGSNGLFFQDNAITQCSSGDGFYCPTSALAFTANLGITPTTGSFTSLYTASFGIANADNMTSTFSVLPQLGGTYSDATTFDWGLPFFYGKRVANAIEGDSTTVGPGPYVAF